jgi:hypothetical protein
MEPSLLTTLNLVTDNVTEPDADLWLGQYQNENVAALFFTDAYGEQLAVATVNLGGYGEYPAEGNVFIKNWGENAGMLQFLISAGVVSKPVRTVPAGYCEAFECELLMTTPVV